MPRTKTLLPKEKRTTDQISLGVIAKTFPREEIDAVLALTNKGSKRQRSLPAHVVMYYVVAMTLLMKDSYCEVLRWLLEGIRWLGGQMNAEVTVTSREGISQARERLGWKAVKRLHDALVQPVAQEHTKGAFYRIWKLIAIDGSLLDVPDTKENDAAFGRPSTGHGKSAYPQIRFLSLLEIGTHVLFASRMGTYITSEQKLARQLFKKLRPGMIVLADRNFYSFDAWKSAKTSGADLLWRMRKDVILRREHELADGSFLSTIYPSDPRRKEYSSQDFRGIKVRVIEYRLEGLAGAEPSYRVITTILNPNMAPAHELAALYQERWEHEGALKELKNSLRGARIILRSKKPSLVIQEFYGFMMAHFAIRGIMHEAALYGNRDPDELSYIHAVRVIRRKLLPMVAFPPGGSGQVS